ncbi:MAG: DUF2147 domain-containing protein [Pseudomonadota bacterium]
MKKIFAAALALMFSTGAGFADPAAGLWRSEPSETGSVLHVRVTPCGADVCGVIQKAVDKNGQTVANYEHQGKTMIWGMKPKGNGAYDGGRIWAADTEKTYKSKMQLLSANQMKVEGCIIGICRGQTWVRLK